MDKAKLIANKIQELMKELEPFARAMENGGEDERLLYEQKKKEYEEKIYFFLDNIFEERK